MRRLLRAVALALVLLQVDAACTGQDITLDGGVAGSLTSWHEWYPDLHPTVTIARHDTAEQSAPFIQTPTALPVWYSAKVDLCAVNTTVLDYGDSYFVRAPFIDAATGRLTAHVRSPHLTACQMLVCRCDVCEAPKMFVLRFA